jgi:two-component system, chemotaxis family, sensor kinase CheA
MTSGVDTRTVLLFRGLDGGRRALPLTVVDRIEEVDRNKVRRSAGLLRVQLGDSLLPLAGTDGDLPGDKVRLLRLSDGRTEIGYAIREVVDLSALVQETIFGQGAGEVAGVTLVGGEPAELIDAHWLFASLGDPRQAAAERPLCRLPADDPWIQNMLRPLVEAAGYRVLGADEDGKADLAIVSETSEETPAADRVVKLRTDPDGGDGTSIYRYDRNALMQLLSSASGGRA